MQRHATRFATGVTERAIVRPQNSIMTAGVVTMSPTAVVVLNIQINYVIICGM